MLLHIVYSAFVWTMKAKVISDAQRTSLIIIHHAAAVGFAGGAQSTKPTDWWGKNTRQLWTVSRNEPLEPNGGLHRPQTIGRSRQERGLECLKLLSTVPADEPQRDRVTIKPLWLSMAKTLECRVCSSLRLLDSSAEETVRYHYFGGSDVRIEGPHYRQLGLQTNTKEACKCEGRFRLLNLPSPFCLFRV